MTKHTTLPIDDLRRLLRYEPDTGLFFRIKNGQPALYTPNTVGYRWGRIAGKLILAHRAAWAITHGAWPSTIDHINRDKSDNRIANLRDVTPLENAHNTDAYQGHGAYISYLARAARWSVRHRGAYVGCFASHEAAIAAVNAIAAGDSGAVKPPRKNRPRTRIVN